MCWSKCTSLLDWTFSADHPYIELFDWNESGRSYDTGGGGVRMNCSKMDMVHLGVQIAVLGFSLFIGGISFSP